jgi:4-amino-4-deoxy-L-arabinose transferase-like glycosyltransferase
MDAPRGVLERALSDRNCRLIAALLILGSAVLRLAYLGYHCPLDLAPDEAHYWDWSRHLDWSYYSKGPGVAWLVRLGCDLFGSLSAQLTGNEMLAVRLPAVVCGSLLLASMYILTIQVSGRHRVALLAVAVALTTPAISAGSSLMTIDSPYACCWGWALVVGYHALFQRSAWAWWLAGVLVGLGVLFKYTMVLWLPSLVCFLLLSPEHRKLMWSRGFWIMCAVAALTSLPILVWNAQHDWVTFRHVKVLAGQDQPHIHWLGPLRYLVIQCGLWMVFWFIVWVRAMLANAPWKASPPSYRYLWWMSAPMFGVFLAFSIKTDGGEPNWPVTAYISGIVLGLLWMVDELHVATGWYRRLALGGLGAACAAGILLVTLVHYSTWAHPLIEPWMGPATDVQPVPLRRIDPTLRLRGWRDLAVHVDQLRHELREDGGDDPILAASGWNMPGLLGFYCENHPVVYTVGPVFGDRRSQYDFWRPNPILDGSQFLGRTFLIISPTPLGVTEAFDSVELRRVMCHMENGKPLGEWVILVCRGYHGFSHLAKNRGY